MFTSSITEEIFTLFQLKGGVYLVNFLNVYGPGNDLLEILEKFVDFV